VTHRVVRDDPDQLIAAYDVAQQRFPITKESPKNTPCLISFLTVFRKVQGAASSARCAAASPSMKYSIFLNTISMSNVCGQVQPHQRRPKAAVKTKMLVRKRSVAKAKMTVS